MASTSPETLPPPLPTRQLTRALPSLAQWPRLPWREPTQPVVTLSVSLVLWAWGKGPVTGGWGFPCGLCSANLRSHLLEGRDLILFASVSEACRTHYSHLRGYLNACRVNWRKANLSRIHALCKKSPRPHRNQQLKQGWEHCDSCGFHGDLRKDRTPRVYLCPGPKSGKRTPMSCGDKWKEPGLTLHYSKSSPNSHLFTKLSA